MIMTHYTLRISPIFARYFLAHDWSDVVVFYLITRQHPNASGHRLSSGDDKTCLLNRSTVLNAPWPRVRRVACDCGRGCLNPSSIDARQPPREG